MSFLGELRKVEETGELAWQLALEGNFRNARRILRKIRNSMFVSERTRATTLVEAKILELRGDLSGARKKIVDSTYSIWGCPDAFEIIAASNPEADSETGHYYVEILGGLARFGFFTSFTENHIGSFDVLANSTSEAIAYIEEVCHFADPNAKTILTCSRNEINSSRGLRRGIIQTYPFRLLEQ